MITICSSYGLDPRYRDKDYQAAVDADVLQQLRNWATGNADDVLKPTGKNMRNLNPIILSPSVLELGWWGYLIDGAPSKFPSINTRSERLESKTSALGRRAIVPASYWREMQKPSRDWYHLTLPEDELIGIAALVQPGHSADGQLYTCYSMVMQEASPHIAGVHDRMPLILPAGSPRNGSPARRLRASSSRLHVPLRSLSRKR